VKRLLAKSTRNEDAPQIAETLSGHTAMVLAAAEQILDQRGATSLDAAALPAAWAERLGRIVRLAAFGHDLGKCSEHFQHMVRGRREPQLIRHEALAAWLLWPGQPLSAWAARGVETEVDVVLAVLAAAGHHRKFTVAAIADPGSGAGNSIKLLTAHPDFGAVLRLRPDLGEPPALADIVLQDSRRTPLRRQLEDWEQQAAAHLRDERTRKLLSIAKALLVAADVAGSALPKGGEGPSWIGDQLRIANENDARADRESVVALRLHGGELRAFQRAVAASKAPITFVRAGCGSGKTVAAYAWAAEQHPTRQLWVTYPTTGTATEGFRDYLDAADVHARLEHGRAEVDVEMFHLRDGDGPSREYDRLEAVRNWGADIVTCTVDTVLGLLQCQRRGVYAWPGLAHGAVVFDEIHAYDDALFGSLLRFLDALPGIPALLMTASLPDARRVALDDLSRRVHGVPLGVVEGPADLERLARYRIAGFREPWPEVARCLDEGGKVLWVSNTVNRCIAVADAAASNAAASDVRIYHSRFRYIDRVARHREVVDAFRSPGAVLATTTQVAEMSLDLSADLLVTDLAPIPALIQRLGRLNRRSTPHEPSPIRSCVVLDDPHALPYAARELKEARAWVQALRGRDLSQRDLVDAWSQPPSAVLARTPSAWLDGGFHTDAAPLREGSEGVTVLLPEDARAVRAGQARVVEVALPMGPPPSGLDVRAWPREGFLPQAPASAIIYDERRGGRWQR
jgi:CRISPR-associated endonuclease/helicase Cas3